MVEYNKNAEYICVHTEKALRDVEKDLRDTEIISLDTETTGLCHYSPDFHIVGFAVSGSLDRGYYIPIRHEMPEQCPLFCQQIQQLPVDMVFPFIQHLYDEKKVVYHNAAFDMQAVETEGLRIPEYPFFDTILAASLIRRPGLRLNLKEQAEYFSGVAQLTIGKLTGGKPENFRYLDIEEATPYAGADAVNTLYLFKIYEQLLSGEDIRIRKLFQMELKLARVVADMEKRGLKLNKEKVLAAQRKAKRQIEEHRARIVEIVNTHMDALVQEKMKTGQLVDIPNINAKELNLNSTRSKLFLFHDLFGYKALRNQRGNRQIKVDERAIKRLLHKKPSREWDGPAQEVLKELLHYNKVSKIYSTYTASLLKLAVGSRIHGKYNSFGTGTGRMSSEDPNMQNWPTLTGELDLRDALEADEGYVFVKADIDAAEVCVLAAVSGDKNMIKAVTDPNYDIHKFVASKAYNIKYKPEHGIDEVSDEHRSVAKTVIFGMFYGRGAWDIATALNISLEEAKNVIDTFFKLFPKLKVLFTKIQDYAMRHGTALTLHGRRRVFTDGPIPGRIELATILGIGINETKARVSSWMRQAVNMLPQGTIADEVKMAMVEVREKLKEVDEEAKIVAQIHDEIAVLCREEKKEEVGAVLENALRSTLRNGVVLNASAEYAYTLTKDKEKLKQWSTQKR